MAPVQRSLGGLENEQGPVQARTCWRTHPLDSVGTALIPLVAGCIPVIQGSVLGIEHGLRARRDSAKVGFGFRMRPEVDLEG